MVPLMKSDADCQTEILKLRLTPPEHDMYVICTVFPKICSFNNIFLIYISISLDIFVLKDKSFFISVKILFMSKF